jgi:hypothetical protein
MAARNRFRFSRHIGMDGFSFSDSGAQSLNFGNEGP